MDFIPLSSSSAGNAYLVKSSGGALLIEAGIPFKRLREKLWAHDVSLSDLAGCLISHRHGDHSRAVKELLMAGVDVFTSAETMKELGVGHHHRAIPIGGGVITAFKDWRVLAFDLHHDVPTHGFLIEAPDREKLLFIPDTSYVRDRFAPVDIIAIETNYCADLLTDNIVKERLPAVVGRRVRRQHTSLDTVKAFLLANDLSKCRQIWLLHLSSGNSDEARMIKEVQETTGIPVYAAGE